jgi:YD repeat-containing protein
MKIAHAWIVLPLLLASNLAYGADKKRAAEDLIPRDLGFAGSFRHVPGQGMELAFSGGERLELGERGALSSFECGNATLLRDSAGRIREAHDQRGARFRFLYNQSGQLISVLGRSEGNFHFSYVKNGTLRSVLFPNRAKACLAAAANP